jgi:hypothetical protein
MVVADDGNTVFLVLHLRIIRIHKFLTPIPGVLLDVAVGSAVLSAALRARRCWRLPVQIQNRSVRAQTYSYARFGGLSDYSTAMAVGGEWIRLGKLCDVETNKAAQEHC